MSEHTIPLLGLSAQWKPCNWAPWLPWKAGWQLQSGSFSFPPPGSTEWASHSPSQIGCENLLISTHRMFQRQIRAWDSHHFVLFFNTRLPNFQKTVKPVSGIINVDNYSHQNDLSNLFLDLGSGTAFFLFFLFLKFLLECICFTMLCYFLLYSKGNQLYLYIYSLFFWISLGHHRALSRVPWATQ